MRAQRAEAARLTAACAIATFGIGAAVLVGWTFGVDAMQRLGLGSIHMLPVTAVTFMLAAASLWMQRVTARDRHSPGTYRPQGGDTRSPSGRIVKVPTGIAVRITASSPSRVYEA